LINYYFTSEAWDVLFATLCNTTDLSKFPRSAQGEIILRRLQIRIPDICKGPQLFKEKKTNWHEDSDRIEREPAVN